MPVAVQPEKFKTGLGQVQDKSKTSSYLLLKLLDLVLQLLLLLKYLLDSLLQLMLLILRGCLLCEDVLLEALQLGHVVLECGQLLLVGNGILLQGSQRRLVLLFQLALL